ncbi:MAG: hypothetical protein Unbinned5079contig1000_47 [Prokaryotic dsDNA virus sp.]|nr:MAG: hypothetical protein Unbinned5079contig1000_47 [Prokaryotic dsDNA virus sp.]|tara:strand:- start:1260 stop:1616 length:357 start_codon:yes stop_codon:yes gene_type:complete
MANTFKVVSHDVMPASSGTPEALYTTPGSTTTVILGLTVANIHTAQVTASIKLVSDTSGGGRTATNTTTFLAKNIPIPVGSSVAPIVGKVVLETTDVIQIDCSVTDKVSITMSIMEIT